MCLEGGPQLGLSSETLAGPAPFLPDVTSGFGLGRFSQLQSLAPASPKMASGVDAKLLKSTKFPPEFNQKVDMTKVNLQVMKK